MQEETHKDLERRTRLVEEAIIEFKFIAKTVVVEHADRIKQCEDDINELKDTLYQSCDIKSKEFDQKVHNVKLSLIKIIAVIATLGLSAVTYFNINMSHAQATLAAQQVKQDAMAESLSEVKVILKDIQSDLKEHHSNGGHGK